MTALDEWLVAIHVLAAVVWVGGAFVTQLYVMRAEAAGPQRLASFVKDTEYIGQRTYVPASLLILATGIWLVSRDVFTLDEWVVWGLIVVVLSFLTGAGYLGPESGRLGKLIEERGPEDAEVQGRMGRLFLISRIELVLLLSVVIVMVTKPFAG